MKRNSRLFILFSALLALGLFISSSAPNVAAATQTPLIETFDNSSQFSTSTPFFSDGSGDYFGVTDGSTGDFGGGALPSALKPYTGFTGNFLTGMDLDGEGAALPIIIEWTGINISDLASIEFSGDFAEFFDDPGDIDEADTFFIEYQIDGGGYQKLIQFSGADYTSTSGPFNGVFREDTDFDGIGDGAALVNAAQTFTKAIPGAGASLDLRMTISLDAGDEDFAVDNFQVSGESDGDAAPTVSGTTPADGATAVPVDSDVTVSFSEDVTVNGTWYTLTCTVSGAVTATVSGGPQTFTLNPDNDFANDEECTLTVLANQVSDVDANDPPDNMAANYSATFTTETAAPASGWVINEILADPATDITGDANGDGVREASGDEFVEIVNNTGTAVDISGWTLTDDDTTAGIVFPSGTVVPDQCAVVVFGGGAPTGSFGGALVFTDDGTIGTGLGNGGDDIIFSDGVNVVATAAYGSEGANDQSLTRDPDITGSDAPFTQHASAAGSAGALFSPGTRVDGTPFAGCTLPVSELLLTEIVVTPTAGEFVEIYNPGSEAVDLSNYYLTDATFPGGSGTYYYNIVTGSNAGGGGFTDFHAHFPDGATIGAGQYQTIAMTGSADFLATYGIAPTYELFDDGSSDGEQVMREALPGSINGQGGLTNGGEIVILYYWDGQSDLVLDVDYAVWGDKDEAVDKTGVAIDGPDADTDTSSYLPDTAIVDQDVIAAGGHSSGDSWQRDDLTEGAEAASGGNGVNGEDETSENVSITWCTNTPTPGAASDCEQGGGATEAFIHEVQGSGANVAMTDPVIVEAVVVADYQGGDQLRGFFLQEEDADADADPATSEGIFVYCGSCAVDVAVGDLVQVTGLPEDFFGMSQIDTTEPGGAISVTASNVALPTPATIALPATGSTEAETTFENVEGMLVTFTGELFVSEYFELARYGQLVLTVDGRPRQFTDEYEPSVAGYTAFLADLNSKRIILDDDNNIQNEALGATPAEDEPFFWPRPGLSNSNLVRGGDSISGLSGVLHWSFAGSSGTDAWRVRPVEEAFTYDFTANNTRAETAAPEDVGGAVKIASFNVLNYFTTLDSRGADSLAELDRQRAKIADAICAMDADVVGLIEIENNGGTAVADLLNGVDGVNANCGPYDSIDTGIIGGDEIAVAFIYRTSTISPVGDYAILDSSVDARFIDTENRPALAQTFMENATGGMVTVVVNHLKSKGSACDGIGDPDIGDGQGNCNLTRTTAAQAMVDWLATDPTGSGDLDFLIIGDLNAYRNEDPIDAIELGADDIDGTDDDYTDLLDALIGPSAYSYVFDGQTGYLDHALANQALLTQVTGVTAWHINADEIAVFDYNDGILDAGEQSFERESTALPIYEPNAYRASDHDPVIVGMDLTTPTKPILLSTTTTLHVDGNTYQDEDVLAFDVDNGVWEQVFDGSDMGLDAVDVVAFAQLDDGSLLMAFDKKFNLAGYGRTTPNDIMRFVPVSLGDDTAGSWELYLDGSDVGLNNGNERIDAIAFDGNGRLLVSTGRNYKVPGLAKGGPGDLIAFNAVSLGDNTAGSWELFFQGEDIGLDDARTENMASASFDAAANTLFFSTDGYTTLSDGTVVRLGDVVSCTVSSFGDNTACSSIEVWSGEAVVNQHIDIDGLWIE